MLDIGFESSLLTSVADFWLSGSCDSSTGGGFVVTCPNTRGTPHNRRNKTTAGPNIRPRLLIDPRGPCGSGSYSFCLRRDFERKLWLPLPTRGRPLTVGARVFHTPGCYRMRLVRGGALGSF